MTESQIKANPTKSTLDAVEHEQDLESQRQKRKDSSIIKVDQNSKQNEFKDKDGNKQAQDVSDDYPFEEAEKQFEERKGKPFPAPVIQEGQA